MYFLWSLTIFCVYIVDSKVKTNEAFVTNNSFTWMQAKSSCKLIGQDSNVKTASDVIQTVWIDAKATYSPWIEYLGCFQVNRQKKAFSYVTAGKQVHECLQICSDYQYIGIQQTRCICPLSNSIVEINDQRCESKTCVQDNDGLCVDDNEEVMYAVYKKVSIESEVGIGNCLTMVENSAGTDFYWANRCDLRLYQVCEHEKNKTGIQTAEIIHDIWTLSHTHCSSGKLGLYSVTNLQKLQLISNTYYWLGDIRRPTYTFYSDITSSRDHCVAAIIDRSGNLERYVEDCNKSLPALCNHPDVTVPTGGLEVERDHITLIVVLISVVVFAGLVLVLLCMRIKKNHSHRLHSKHPSSKTIDSDKAYAEIRKPDTDLKPISNIYSVQTQSEYDHINHCKNGTENKNGNIYDINNSIEESEDHYDHTNTKEHDKQFAVNSGDYVQISVRINEVSPL
ncbi:uncharacterized protein LOC134683037 isoform X1 [Mytilus trossulus]|uniref:uncharacterized protein LOC134683037 isoform X1 n=1 Tax=Mytilus trossulus TaxID=6551 RepID=UPI003005FB40